MRTVDNSVRQQTRTFFMVVGPLVGITCIGLVLVWIPGVTLYPAMATVPGATLVVVSLVSLFIAVSGRVPLANMVFVSGMLLAIALSMTFFGSTRGSDIAALPLVVLFAGLQGGRWHAISFALLNILMVIVITVFESTGYIPLVGEEASVVVNALVAVAVIGVSVWALLLALEGAERGDRRVAAILDSSPDGFAAMSADGVITDCNRRLEELARRPYAELLGTRFIDLPELSSESQQRLRRAIGEALTGNRNALTEIELGRDEPTYLEIHARMVEHDNSRTVHLTARDITHRKRARRLREELERQLRETHHLESIGRLAGGVAHDFNNLLTAVLANGELIARDEQAPDSTRMLALEIVRAGERAGDLTQQLLAFARRQVRAPRVLSLSAVLLNVAPILKRLLPETIELQVVPGSQPLAVRADPSQLEQVIINLAANARDAMPRGGKLTIETTAVALDEHYGASHPDVAPGPYVLLCVSDTGSGMDEATLDHVFEPFFTTKRSPTSSGLGLATVHGIVKQSGGHISVYSEPDAGTSFKVYLPAVEGSLEAHPARQANVPVQSGSATVLVVDDEALVRDTTARLLQKAGYQVLTAKDGAEALVVAQAHEGIIDLLLTDVVLPKRRGPELARELMSSRPNLCVLYISGYAENAIVHRGTLDDGVHFLAKPFSYEALAAKVAEVLEAGASSAICRTAPGP